ncbi:MAG: type II secretion system protein [Phycisphaerae bacterium]|nr:type II secretion system protein [Phycisphaerae bacterium]MDD5381099.1 type II secretion system protein [Phycisphaerae bacterium]
MKSKSQIYAKTGFTIIELLTIMSIIVILVGALLPALNMIRWYARYTTQKNQFRNIETGLQTYEFDYGEYPDSGALDTTDEPYCGAMKLAEAMAGQDGLGFNPDSKFTADDGTGDTELYPPFTDAPWYYENLKKRKEYLEAKDVQLSSLTGLYGTNIGDFPFPDEVALLSDVYKRNELRNSKGTKLGMPILYYRADPAKLLHDANYPDNPDNIYNYTDNQDLLELGVPWSPSIVHPLYQDKYGNEPGYVFYQKTMDESALPIERPYNKNSYILISAGGDGIFGNGGSMRTKDVYNFAGAE